MVRRSAVQWGGGACVSGITSLQSATLHQPHFYICYGEIGLEVMITELHETMYETLFIGNQTEIKTTNVRSLIKSSVIKPVLVNM